MSAEPALAERRSYLRFETVLPVLIESHQYGSLRCIARNVSTGGLCLEMDEPFPLGSAVRVWFTAPDGTQISATGQVKHHYVFNYCSGPERYRQLRGMGVRFTEFETTSEHALNNVLDRLQ